MILRDTCYFCTSSFQLIPIMALALERGETADLYIDPQFKNINQLAEQLQDAGLFCNVVVIDSKLVHKKYLTAKSAVLKHFQIARSYLYVNEIVKDILLDETVYRHMFISSKAYIPRLVYLYIVKNNLGTELRYFDDGIGSYYANNAYTPRSSDKFIRRVLFGEKAVKLNCRKYLFSPDFYSLMNPQRSEKVEVIPRIIGNEKLIQILNRIFTFDNNSLIQERYILLDVLKSTLFTKDNRNKLLSIYNMLVESIGYDEIIVKKHPRTLENENLKVKYYLNTGVPFESICMNTDMNQKVLISYGSTAVSTPKILFDQEPIIILLYRLVHSKTINDKSYDKLLDDFFTKIQQLYIDKAKVIIPDSIYELENALKKIKNKC